VIEEHIPQPKFGCVHLEYLRGWRDSVDALAARLLEENDESVDRIPVIVVLHSTAAPEQVQGLLAAYGLERIEILQNLPVLRGIIDPNRIQELTTVPRVASVEREREIQVAPPDSPVQ